MTFEDPVAAASDLSTALRGLAYETRTFPAPAATYVVIGELMATIGALRQVLQQVAEVRALHVDTARNDDGDLGAGRVAAVEAESALRQSAATTETVERLLDTASASSGRIVWPAAGTTPPSPPASARGQSVRSSAGSLRFGRSM